MMLYRSLIRIVAIAEKEWIQIRRDTRSLILSIFLPVFLLLIFGYALTMDVKNVATAVFDQDRSRFSRQLVEKFSHTEYIRLDRYVGSYREIDDLNIQIFRELFTFMAESPGSISQSLGLIMIAKALERVGDHATNIAERVIFYIEGVDIRGLEKRGGD